MEKFKSTKSGRELEMRSKERTDLCLICWERPDVLVGLFVVFGVRGMCLRQKTQKTSLVFTDPQKREGLELVQWGQALRDEDEKREIHFKGQANCY